MRQITSDQLKRLLSAHETPCISLYQPTHRQYPENQQDPIRFRNLVGEIEAALREKYPTREVRALLEKFQPLARDNGFWKHRTEALAILCSPEMFELFELQRPLRELVVVADSFHLKPLLRILQSADRYQILCLTRSEARLYQGNRDALDPVELTEVPTSIDQTKGEQRTQRHQMIGSYGAQDGGGGKTPVHGHGSATDEIENETIRFFRAVDRGIWEHHSRPSGLPLMLAALPESHDLFRQISHNPNLMAGGIMRDPDSLTLEQLRTLAWESVQPLYLARLERLKDNFHTARAQHAGSADLSDIARAAVAGRVAVLLVEADRVIPGRLDRMTGAVSFEPPGSPEVDDLIDDVMEVVLRTGGEVVVVPAERMPTESGVAATFRH